MGDGSLAYVTKRFDRKGKAKIAVEDLCQLSELLTEQKYRSSHEQVGKMIRRYSSVPGDDVLRFFELLVFSFVVGNSDMHLKNFSFITENADKVRLSPAYDLLSVRLVISAKEDPEELALSLNGKKSKLSRKDFEVCAASLKISPKVCSMVLQKQIGAMPAMKALVDRSFLHQKNRGHLKAIITENIAKLKVMS
jgi:serine/threonine-protein kinase HipA